MNFICNFIVRNNQRSTLLPHHPPDTWVGFLPFLCGKKNCLIFKLSSLIYHNLLSGLDHGRQVDPGSGVVPRIPCRGAVEGGPFSRQAFKKSSWIFHSHLIRQQLPQSLLLRLNIPLRGREGRRTCNHHLIWGRKEAAEPEEWRQSSKL